MSEYLSDSPVAVEALVGALDAEAGQGTSDTPPNPAEAPKAGQDAPKPGAESSQAQGGTTAQKPAEGATAPAAEQKQSPFPKELEPHKALFEKKKWDPTKPDWQGQALTTLAEQEQFQGRLTTDLGLTRTQAAELSQFILGTPQDINAYRQRMGASPLSFDSASLDDKIKAAGEEWDLWQKALDQDERVSAEAIRTITQKLKTRMEDLRLDKKAEEKFGKPATQTDAKARQDIRNANWAKVVQKDPDANKAMSALIPYLKSKLGTGILGSFGMDVYNVMDSEERAMQVYDLAARVLRGDPEHFKAEVEKGVKAELERQRGLAVQGGIPGGAPATATTTQTTDPALEHLAGVQ